MISMISCLPNLIPCTHPLSGWEEGSIIFTHNHFHALIHCTHNHFYFFPLYNTVSNDNAVCSGCARSLSMQPFWCYGLMSRYGACTALPACVLDISLSPGRSSASNRSLFASISCSSLKCSDSFGHATSSLCLGPPGVRCTIGGCTPLPST